MGVRFECPNGHRLNVKAFLAGKRGICPHCDAKFIVPAESGGRAMAVDDGDRVEGPVRGAAAAKAATPMAQQVSNVPVAGEQSLPVAWYVRSATGEQFGPANSELMQSWVDSGRVPEDSWVWRTGWENWKIGSEALADFLGPPSIMLADVASENSVEPAMKIQEHAPVESFSARYRSPNHGSRRDRAQKATFVLGALVLLLTLALVLVLWS